MRGRSRRGDRPEDSNCGEGAAAKRPTSISRLQLRSPSRVGEAVGLAPSFNAQAGDYAEEVIDGTPVHSRCTE
jgi:hypothetical protein